MQGGTYTHESGVSIATLGRSIDKTRVVVGGGRGRNRKRVAVGRAVSRQEAGGEAARKLEAGGRSLAGCSSDESN